jgi:hypothetical protein
MTVLLVQLPPLIPIIPIVIILALALARCVICRRLDFAAFNVAFLLIRVLFLREPDELLLTLPLRLRIESHELLLSGIVGEFYEDRFFEAPVGFSSKPNGIQWTVGGKEGLDIELGRG